MRVFEEMKTTTTVISQAKDITRVNCDKLLTIAHKTGEMKTTTSAARACWLFLRNKGYAVAGLLLWQGDHAWAGGFEFKAEGGWTTIRYIELDPANPLEEDLELERDSDFHGDNKPDGPDCDQQVEEAIENHNHNGMEVQL